MNNFKYYAPTEVLFGRDTESNVATLIKKFGGNKVLIHYGGGSVIRTGLLKKIKDILDTTKIDYITLGGAVSNPRLGLVYEGIELCKKRKCRFYSCCRRRKCNRLCQGNRIWCCK